MSRRSHWSGSRRELLRTGVWLGAAAACGPAYADVATPPAAAPPAPEPLITKPIPASGEHLPAIGIGTDAFGDADAAAVRAVLDGMVRTGGTVIDTAAAYGDSEARIGAASFERSLKRLQTDHIDLLQVHNLDGVDALMPLLRQLKQAGKIRYLGITTSRVGQQADMMAYMRKYPLDFVQVDYSLGDRAAADTLLPLAQQRGIAVLANLPLGRASLIRQAARRPLPPWAADIDVHSWGQFLLKYVISHPAVTCAIPGSTQLAHLQDNQGAARGRLPDTAMRRRGARAGAEA